MFKRKDESKSESEKIEEMYDKYKNLMFREANNILKDKQLSEDAVHQAFINVIKNIDKIDEKDDVRTRSFLVIVCRNAAIDIYKNRLYMNQKSDSIDFELDDGEDGEPTDYVEPSKVVIDKETVNKIADAIAKLPQIYKDVLLLEKIHNNTRKEIAELLNISYESVKKRSLRARKMLAEALEMEDLK